MNYIPYFMESPVFLIVGAFVLFIVCVCATDWLYWWSSPEGYERDRNEFEDQVRREQEALKRKEAFQNALFNQKFVGEK